MEWRGVKEIFFIHPPGCGGTWLRTALSSASKPFFVGDIGHRSVEEMRAGGGSDRVQQPARYWESRKRPFPWPWYDPESTSLRFGLSGRFKLALKVSVCRNPYEYLTSLFFKNDGRGVSDINELNQLHTFEDFIKSWIDSKNKWVVRNDRDHFIQINLFHQMFYFDGTCGVDTILRNEELTKATEVLLVSNGYASKEQVRDSFPYYRINENPEFVGGNQTHRDELMSIAAAAADLAEQGPTAKWRKALKVSKHGRHRHYIEKRIRSPEPAIVRDHRKYYNDELRELVEKHCKVELDIFGYDFDGPKSDPRKCTHDECVLANQYPTLFAHVCQKIPAYERLDFTLNPTLQQ